MRIVVHSINYYPEVTGIAKYATEMCEWLASRGHEVTVVAPPPYYPRWRVEKPYRQWCYETEMLNGVRVKRAPIWVPSRPGGISRVLYEMSFALASFPRLIREALRRPDIVMVIQPSFLNCPVAWLSARIGGGRAWLHVQDFEIDLAYDLGQLKRARRLALAVESWIARRFDVVSAISKRMMKRARAKHVDPARIFLFPNWFDPSIIYPTSTSGDIRHCLNIPPDSPVALFSGTLGFKQGVESIIEVGKLLHDSAIHFVVCGEGVAERSLKSMAGDAANVHFLPLQPANRLNALLNAADIHLLPQREGAAKSVFPSKLIGMLASGRPVVAMAGADSEIGELLAGCGVCVPYGDVSGLADAIRQLISRPSERRKMGHRARARALERFRQDVILPGLEAKLARTCGAVDVRTGVGMRTPPRVAARQRTVAPLEVPIEDAVLPNRRSG